MKRSKAFFNNFKSRLASEKPLYKYAQLERLAKDLFNEINGTNIKSYVKALWNEMSGSNDFAKV